MISCHLIPDLPYIWCHTSAYLVLDEIYGFSWSRTVISTYEIHAETRTCSLFYHGPLVEPFLSHLVKPAFFGIQMSSYFPFWGTLFLSVSLIQLLTWMTRTTHSMMDDLRSSDFLTYYTSGAILGHISSLVEIYRSSWICMITPSYEIPTELMIWLHLALILQWSLSWDIRSSLYFLILSWFLDIVISDA